MKKIFKKIQTFDKNLCLFSRKHHFLATLIKSFFFILRSLIIGVIISFFVDLITPNSFTQGQIFGCIFVIYSIIGYPSDIFLYDDILDHHLQRIESLEEKTDLLEAQQDCIEKWYLNDDL